jgi:hypothetical protein
MHVKTERHDITIIIFQRKQNIENLSFGEDWILFLFVVSMDTGLDGRLNSFLLIWMVNYRIQWENACVFRGGSWIWNKIHLLNSLMIFEAMLSDQKIEMELGTWSDFIYLVSGLDSIETIIINVAKAFQLPVRTDISWKRMYAKLCNTLFSEICYRLVLRYWLWSHTQLAHPNNFLGSLWLVPGLPKQWKKKSMRYDLQQIHRSTIPTMGGQSGKGPIFCAASGLALSPILCNKGSNMISWEYHRHENQKWRFDPITREIFLVAGF